MQRVSQPSGRASYAARCLAVRKYGKIDLIDALLYVTGAGSYSELVLFDGRRELHDKTLERLETVLPPVFERVHKSYIVRMSEVVSLITEEGGHYEIELKDGIRLPVGRSRYRQIKARLH